MVPKWCPSPQKRLIKRYIKIHEFSTVREVTKRDAQHCGAAASAEVRAMHKHRAHLRTSCFLTGTQDRFMVDV